MRNVLSIVFSLVIGIGFGQGSTCGSPISLGTPPSGTPTCATYTFPTTGSAPCAGAGYGGSGGVMYFSFCTNAANDCIVFDFTNATSGNFAATVYTPGCISVIGADCMGNSGSGATLSTTNLSGTLTGSTCYVLRVWAKDGGTFDLCYESVDPPNDECAGAMGIDAIPQSTDNYCFTPGASDPAPADLCAGSLENTAWY